MSDTIPFIESTAAIGLGSNLGDRFANMSFAVSALAANEKIRIEKISSVFETEAHVLEGAHSQPDYLNSVVLVCTSLGPEALLQVCLEIEKTCGRSRSPAEHWQPRELDIDILTFGLERIDSELLTVPHPRMLNRLFVLKPLFEIAPDLNIPPPIDRTVQYLLENCLDTSRVTLFTERLIAPQNS